MKKFATSIILCLALAQNSFAATTALIESVFEYDAILNTIGDPGFTVIPQNEFIIDIRRITREIDSLGTVKYKIITKEVGSTSPEARQGRCHSHSHKNHCHDHNRDHNGVTHVYIATLTVTANPGVGPNIITVDSIEQVR